MTLFLLISSPFSPFPYLYRMKNIFLSLAFSLTLFSCSKDSDKGDSNQQDSATPAFRFNANGKFFEWNYGYQQTPTKSVGLVKIAGNQYTLSALSDGEYLQLGIPATLLFEKAYTYNYSASGANGFTEALLTPLDPADKYTTAHSGDYITVEITRITNGLATGTFRAQLSVAGNTSKKLDITSGVFANIKVVE